MKRTIIFIFILLITSSNIWAQCLCGYVSFNLTVNDLEFNANNSNYELAILNAPNWMLKTPKKFTKQQFKNNSLKFSLPTKGGIDSLVVEIRNVKQKTTMNITVKNMTYDNDYHIDLTTYKSGSYGFNWETIDRCQKENRNNRFIDCDNLKFEQLILKTPDSNQNAFVKNHIKPLDLIYFDIETEAYYTKHTSEIIDGTIDKMYHLENNKYLILQHGVSGSGNHYYDDIKIRIIELNGSIVKNIKTTIEIDTKLGYEYDDEGLILSQHQGYSAIDEMSVLYHNDTKILAIKIYWANINADDDENELELHQLYYKYSNSKFEKISENVKSMNEN